MIPGSRRTDTGATTRTGRRTWPSSRGGRVTSSSHGTATSAIATRAAARTSGASNGSPTRTPLGQTYMSPVRGARRK
jgi:hypothetical protein